LGFTAGFDDFFNPAEATFAAPSAGATTVSG
jgi:hypothetical protein